jgi:hypothetical protein
LTWVLASGALPDVHGWRGWLFTSRWDETQKTHIHRLVAPNGFEYSAGEILSWHFQYQRLAHLSREIKALRKKPIPEPVINPQETYRKLSIVQSALDDLAEHLKVSGQPERQHA